MRDLIYEVITRLGYDGDESDGFNRSLDGAIRRAEALDLCIGLQTPHAFRPGRLMDDEIDCLERGCSTSIIVRSIDD